MSEGPGRLPTDADGHTAQQVCANYGKIKRFAVTATAWVDITDFGGLPYSQLMIQAPSTNAAVVVLHFSNGSDASNDPTNAGYGLEIAAGKDFPWQFTENVKVYAKVKTGGADCKITTAVGF